MSSPTGNNENSKRTTGALALFLEHGVALLGFSVTLLVGLGYAAGASFHEGWSNAAGISPTLFQLGPYETIITGFKFQAPWLYSLIVIAALAIYIYILNIFDAWYTRRNAVIRLRGKSSESMRQKQQRYRLATAARIERARKLHHLDGSVYQAWLQLGPRSKHRHKQRSIGGPIRTRNSHFIRYTAWLMIQLVMLIFASVIYWLATFLVVAQPSQEGAQQFMALYAAVVGKLPARFGSQEISSDEMARYICRGRAELWKYIAIELHEQPLASGAGAFYVVRSTDKFLLLISKDGTTLRSYGDAEFSLLESTNRPLSDIAKQCGSV